jgi:hypothetical protein
MEAVYSVGRFQPPTIGHAAMIQALIATGKPAFVFVSSSTSPRDKNPLTSGEKVDFLRKMFPSGVTFVDTAECEPRCGGPVAAREHLVTDGYTKLTLVGGSDRKEDFGPGSRIWEYLKKEDYGGPREPPTFMALQRAATDASSSTSATKMSGTKARGFAVEGDLPSFIAAVKMGNVTDADAEELYNLLRERLMEPPRKRARFGGSDEDVAMIDEDSEPTGGRRKHKKTRRVRKIRRTRRH